MDTALTKSLMALQQQAALPAAYLEQVEPWLRPLARWLAQCRKPPGSALLVGVNGAQGTGKTTLCRFLELLLAEQGRIGLTLALDDFYLGRAARRALARRVHPLLATRGVPGTHRIAQLRQTLDALLAGRAATWPRFDKALDEIAPQSAWHSFDGRADILLLEGWCIACPPQSAAVLDAPVNALEAAEDSAGHWRRFVNTQLTNDYRALFDRLDKLLMLQAPSIAAVVEWRTLQERKLAARGGGRSLGDAEITRFVQHCERLTQHCLAELPARADYLLQLDEEHQIVAARAG